MSIWDMVMGKRTPQQEDRPAPRPPRNTVWQKVVDSVGPLLINIPDEHWNVFWRKRSRLLVKDEYGANDDTAWEAEKSRYIKKHIMPQIDYDKRRLLREYLDYDYPLVYFFKAKDQEKLIVNLISQWIEQIIDSLGTKVKASEFHTPRPTNGYEYEHYCAKILKENGWEVTVTKASGDQGADIRAKKDGVSIVAQCKLFSSPVGNKAVQEVFASQRYYSASYGVVITNNGFTKSARQLAASNHVILIHDSDIPNLYKSITSYR